MEGLKKINALENELVSTIEQEKKDSKKRIDEFHRLLQKDSDKKISDARKEAEKILNESEMDAKRQAKLIFDKTEEKLHYLSYQYDKNFEKTYEFIISKLGE